MRVDGIEPLLIDAFHRHHRRPVLGIALPVAASGSRGWFHRPSSPGVPRGRTQGAEHLTCQLAFQAADDLQLGEAIPGASLGVGARAGIVTQAHHDRYVQSAVGGAITAAVQSMAPRGAARGGDRSDAAETCEGSLAAHSLGVIAAVTGS